MKEGVCMFSRKATDRMKRKKIVKLYWGGQWDISLFSGKKYINMTIDEMDGQVLFVHSSRIPGYEELSMERSWYIPLSDIKSITEPPDRDACLCPIPDIISGYSGHYRMMHMSAEERKQYDAILVEDMWSLLSAGKVEKVRIYGADTVIYMDLDPLGRIHLRNCVNYLGSHVYSILEDTYEKLCI